MQGTKLDICKKKKATKKSAAIQICILLLGSMWLTTGKIVSVVIGCLRVVKSSRIL